MAKDHGKPLQGRHQSVHLRKGGGGSEFGVLEWEGGIPGSPCHSHLLPWCHLLSYWAQLLWCPFLSPLFSPFTRWWLRGACHPAPSASALPSAPDEIPVSLRGAASLGEAYVWMPGKAVYRRSRVMAGHGCKERFGERRCSVPF